jgi:hypothetical protein
MPKLHELLAAESNVAAAANAIAEETLKVLGRPEAFVRTVTKVAHFAEEDQKLDTVQSTEITTTVKQRLAYSLGRAWQKHVDLLVSKDATNQDAKADIVVGGQVLVYAVPATALLTLEKQLGAVRVQLEVAPTLPAGLPWRWDPAENLFVTEEPKVSFRTRKTVRPIVLTPATKEHPAQVQTITEDVPIAKIEQTQFSGMWTSAEKADTLARLDTLLVAVKKARQRANRTEVKQVPLGRALTEFILNGPAGDLISDVDSLAD